MRTSKKSNPDVTAMVAEAAPWLEWLNTEGRSPRTITGYRYVVVWLARFMVARRQVSLRDVQRTDLEAWLRFLIKEGYSPVTVGCYLHPLLGLFAWLEQRGEIFLNPCRGLELPDTPRRLMPVPSEAQMLRLVNSVTGSSPVDLRDRAILEVAYATGFRCRELVSLDVDSVDLAEGVIQVIGKGAAERKGLLTQAAIAALRVYLTKGRPELIGDGPEKNALWVAPRHGRRLGTAGLRIAVKGRAKAIGLTITPHAIRRAFATHLLRHGATPLQLRRLLGHISYRSLKHYLRYAPEDLLRTHRQSRLGQ